MSHTPGPWLVSHHPLNWKMVNVVGSVPLAAGDLPTIADLPTSPEGTANAHLIAAAPEMLETLIKVRVVLGPKENAKTKSLFDLISDLEEVIKKARGDS